ncbi:MAG TPA: hypothetical protein VGB18_04400 [Candidatus Thermoplasmatota archaeon]
MLQRRRTLIALALASLIAAGCLDESSQSQSPQPTTTQAAPPGRTIGFNMSGCTGQELFASVPVETVADDLPSAYEPFPITQATTWIIIRIDDCAHVAVDGADVGAAHLVSFGVPVTIRGESTNKSGSAYVYSLDILSNSEPLVAWLLERGATTHVATLSKSTVQTAADYAQMEGDIAAEGEPWYSWAGASRTNVAERHDDIHLFFGDDPATDFFQTQANVMESMSDGQGVLEIQSTSTIGEVMNGAPALTTFIGQRDATVHSFRASLEASRPPLANGASTTWPS